jgi:MerR family transcriptional regulator, thiopeptide resistance regulator
MNYTIKQLAQLAGVSVRTLHYYDSVGVLKPAYRSPSGYRYYGPEELLRLQQALLYRELGLPLERISVILDAPGFDLPQALAAHRERLAAEARRLERLIGTIDKTLEGLQGGRMLADEELYEGFSAEEVASIKAESEARWGETYRRSEARVRSWSKAELEEVKAEGQSLEAAFREALLAGRKPEGPAVLAIAAAWSKHINRFYDAPPELMAGLGRMYAEDERFLSRYEAMTPGLAVFIRDALAAWTASPKKSTHESLIRPKRS